MDRNLCLEFVRVTERAAVASARWMGRGDEKAADQAAVDAMRKMLDSIYCDATVVIGEGERDEAPMLYIGEKVGMGKGPVLEIALDPLEGTTVCASGQTNSLSVMAIGEEGGLLHAPDIYMKKIATGPSGTGVVDINESVSKNLKELARAKKCNINDLTAIILNRPRHQELIAKVRESGARIRLIGDGDIAAAMACCDSTTGVDILFGTGGAPEGVIAAAALRCMGGWFQGILVPRNDADEKRARKMGIDDINKVYSLEELARGHVMFCATGVTDGSFLKGVRFKKGEAVTHSIVMRSLSGTVRHIMAEHRLSRMFPTEGA